MLIVYSFHNADAALQACQREIPPACDLKCIAGLSFNAGVELQQKIAYLENVFQALKGNCDNAHIRAVQQVAQGLDAACPNQVLDLIVRTSTGGIADCPSALFSDVKFRSSKKVYQGRDDVVLDHRLSDEQMQSSIRQQSL